METLLPKSSSRRFLQLSTSIEQLLFVTLGKIRVGNSVGADLKALGEPSSSISTKPMRHAR